MMSTWEYYTGRLATHALDYAFTQASLYGGVYSGLCTMVEIRGGSSGFTSRSLYDTYMLANVLCMSAVVYISWSSSPISIPKSEPTIYFHDRQA